MKQFFAVVLLIAGAAAVSGQTYDYSAHAQGACTLKLEHSPAVNGLRLGMTAEQVLALFPGSLEDAEVRASLTGPPRKYGISGFSLRPEKYSSKSKFAGVTQITLTLLDGRVFTLNVNYQGPEWKHVDEFVTKFSEGTKLPAAHAWEPYVGMETQLKTLKCRDFEINVFAGGKNVRNINYVQMRDMEAQKKLEERRAKATEKTWWGTSP